MENELMSENEYVIRNTEYVLRNKQSSNFEERSKTNPLFKCPKCGNGVRKIIGIRCPTNPPKYIYECDGCDYVTYHSF